MAARNPLSSVDLDDTPPQDSSPLAHSGIRSLAAQSTTPADSSLGDELAASEHETIRAANEEFAQLAGKALELPLGILIEQRDRALRELHAERERNRRLRQSMVEEQDRFIALLVEDYETQLAELRSALDDTRHELDCRRSIAPVPIVPVGGSRSDGARSERPIDAESARFESRLQERLDLAEAELEALRSDARRFQDERDEAIGEALEARTEARRALDTKEDEVLRLKWQLDEAYRRIEDVRDEARREAFRLQERLDEARRELDDRRDEAYRLKERLDALDVPTTPSSH